MNADDESTVTEIELAADGRVYVFGASREVLESLDAIGVRGSGLQERLIVFDATHSSHSSPTDRPITSSHSHHSEHGEIQ